MLSSTPDVCGHNDIFWTLITTMFALEIATESAIIVIGSGHKLNK